MAEVFSAYELIEEIGLNPTMNCTEVFEKVFDYYRDIYDGQVTDLEVADIAEGATQDLCGYLEIVYHRQEWT